MRTSTVLFVLATAVAAASPARAGLFHRHEEGTPPPGRPRCIPHTMERAGHPLWISAHAHSTNTPDYVGYYVGGGAAHGGAPRTCEEGTWGWDYEGLWFRRHVVLGWWHGRHDQGGTGSYRTNGPHLPDVFVVPRHERGGE